MRIRRLMFALVLCVGGCCYYPPPTNPAQANWRQQEAADLRQLLDTHGSHDVQFFASTVAQLDHNTLLLGGSCYDPHPVRSALLRSTDGGKTWQDTGVWLSGSQTSEIFVLDAQHAWAVVNWTIEGWLPPFVVFRTTDGGRTWQRSLQNLPLGGSPGIADDFGICFASPDVGIAWLVSSTGEQFNYVTTNGGITWRLVHRSKVIEADSMTGPPRVEPDEHGGHQILLQNADESETRVIPLTQIDYRIRDDGSLEPR